MCPISLAARRQISHNGSSPGSDTMEAKRSNPVHYSVPRYIHQRRWWLIPLLLWIGGSMLYFHGHLRDMQQQLTAVGIEGARNMFRMVVLTRDWNSSHGGVYVPVTPTVQPNPYLDHPQRDITTTDGVEMTMINPAYMTRLIGEMAATDDSTIFRLTSLKPIRPANLADAWESRQLERFEQGIRESWSVENGESGGQQLRYMAPLVVKESCLVCHAQQGYRLGDIRGGISVTQDYAPIGNALAKHRAELLKSTLATCLLIALLGWALLELLRRRWIELAGKIEEVESTHRQLLQSEKLAAIGQLAAGVAHEINNPVGFVNSNLGTLGKYGQQMIDLLDKCRQGQASEADFAAFDYDYLRGDLPALLKESRDGLERVRRIVADLKDFSRIDQANEQDFDLDRGLESTLNVVWNELKYKATVVREFGNPPPVRCIGAQINQVALNLLVNAGQAIAEHGTITVRSGFDDSEVWFEISDSGCGMTADVLPHIFEPFYTTRPVGQGTGLGLALSYDIVRKHGGRLEVDSEPGRGSRFRVNLPRSDRA